MQTSPGPIKAIVLAAGFGTRLKPLTLARPKPLFPFFGPSLLDIAICRLRQGGFQQRDSIAVNAHHLSSQIVAWVSSLNQLWDQTPVCVSVEENILGTGGFINPLRDWIGDHHLLVYNGDTVTDIDMDKMIQFHFDKHAIATMAILPHHQANTSPVWVTGDAVSQISGSLPDAGSLQKVVTPHTFTGIHILSPEFLRRLPRTIQFHNIIDTYQTVLAEGQETVRAFPLTGLWHDMGTPDGYQTALVEYLRQLTSKTNRDTLQLGEIARETGRPFQILPADRGGYFVRSMRANIAPEVRIAAESFLMEDTQVLSGARVGSGVVAFQGAILKAGVAYDNCLVTSDCLISI